MFTFRGGYYGEKCYVCGKVINPYEAYKMESLLEKEESYFSGRFRVEYICSENCYNLYKERKKSVVKKSKLIKFLDKIGSKSEDVKKNYIRNS